MENSVVHKKKKENKMSTLEKLAAADFAAVTGADCASLFAFEQEQQFELILPEMEVL